MKAVDNFLGVIIKKQTNFKQKLPKKWFQKALKSCILGALFQNFSRGGISLDLFLE